MGGDARLRRASPAVARVLDRHPDLSPRPLPSAAELREEALAGVLDALSASDPEAAAQRALRRLKYPVVAHLILRDLDEGPAGLEQVTAGLSDLADALLHAALRFADERLARRHGRPEGWPEGGGLVAFALGKHGGRELNYSSDVDIVLVTAAEGGLTDGPRPVDAVRYAHRLVARATTLMAEHTADGFCFRVDLDLRPDGVAGPPTLPAGAAELYYLTYGRTWERAAWLKARVAAGDAELGAEVLARLEPFRYRRSLDFATLDAIASMRDRIAEAHRLRAFQRDLKRGPGGIRAVEFLVQAQQLVWAGRDPWLRVGGTAEAARTLAERGCLPGVDVDELLAAWRTLRCLEHRLQWPQEAQTQRLPDDDDEAGWAHLAWASGTDVSGVKRRLAQAREVVEQAWAGLMVRDQAQPQLDPFASTQQRIRALEDAGIEHAQEAQRWLDRLGRVGARDRMREADHQRFQRVAPRLIRLAAAGDDAPAALRRLEEFVSRVGARGITYSLLEENPAVAEALMALFSGSAHLSELFLAHPELLDALVLRGRGGERPPRSAAQLAGELEPALASRADGDDALLALRTFRTVELLRIGMADLASGLPGGQPGPWLSELARACVQGAAWLARSSLAPRFGSTGPMAVIGLGSVGSGWMSYGSDLDLAFVYGAAAPPSDGRKELPAATWAARWCQRLVTALSAPSREGRCYEVDLRLRPDGSSGAVIARLPAYASYYRKRARPFERIALARAAVVHADDESFGHAVQELLAQARIAPDPEEAVAEARDMLRRQREELGWLGSRLALKRGPGGLAELEFAVACLQSTREPGHPALDTGDPREAVARLEAAGDLGAADAREFEALWSLLRRVEADLRLRVGVSGPVDVDGASFAQVARARGRSPQELAQELRQRTEEAEALSSRWFDRARLARRSPR